MIRLVAFDFDGVLVDSAQECYVTALAAFRKLGGRLADTPKARRAFQAARRFVLVGEDFWPVLEAIEADPDVDFARLAQADFNRLKRRHAPGRQRFANEFYHARWRMMHGDFQKWAGLQAIYPGMQQAANWAARRWQAVILTAKDKKSTVRLLGHFGIKIGPERIISKESRGSKTAKLLRLARQQRLRPGEILLVEDMAANALAARRFGFQVALAAWGYASQEQLRQAQAAGIPILRNGNKRAQLERIIRSTA
ncbi:MAG: HAD family hydrolase [Candidatus Aenigmarchaeota archaeon]|nr:HAD family hydrolase [Candidatus Aenigmarchaeota archaeon]